MNTNMFRLDKFLEPVVVVSPDSRAIARIFFRGGGGGGGAFYAFKLARMKSTIMN